MTSATRSRPGTIGAAITVIVLCVVAGFPIYWVLNTALSNGDELYSSGQDVWPHLERLFSSVGKFFSGDIPMVRWLVNSGIIAFGTMALSLLMALSAAYALSRYRFAGKGVGGFILFVTQMLPEALLVVPFWTLFSTLGLLNNLGGLVLANVAFSMPVATWILKGAMDSVPLEVEEAARVDGCSRLGILIRIITPLITPSLAAAAVISFFDGWNEFLFARTFLKADNWPASVGLSTFIGQFSTPLDQVMMATLVFTIPAIVFFLILQRRIVSGLTAGAVKG